MTGPALSDSELEKIGEEIRHCTRSHLSMTRTNSVPGEGSSNARVMFIGEGPGRQEDLEGRPFVGRAGRLLDELLASIKLDRKSVYITNIVKCRPSTETLDETLPPEKARDRKPTSEEIAACAPYLEAQINAIKPQIICTLGDTATRFILEKYGLKTGNISKVHGRTYSADNVKIIPMYHPAAALYTAELREILEKDFKKLAGLLAQRTLAG